MVIKHHAIVRKALARIPAKIRDMFVLLEEHLRQTSGKPYNKGWKNVGQLKQLGADFYHCHLTDRYVAVWKIDEDAGVCQIYYIGTREKAPY